MSFSIADFDNYLATNQVTPNLVVLHPVAAWTIEHGLSPENAYVKWYNVRHPNKKISLRKRLARPQQIEAHKLWESGALNQFFSTARNRKSDHL